MPCISQDARTGEVLTLAYMNAEALALTRETGELHFFSRSRGELWRKGETSGNVMKVRALRYDCDADALLALVDPAGPACHTGERTCFYRGEMELTGRRGAARSRADDRRARRESPRTAATPPSCSPTRPRIGEKVREEAGEVADAAARESDERVREEAADVLYHLAVLLRSRGLSLADAKRRAQRSPQQRLDGVPRRHRGRRRLADASTRWRALAREHTLVPLRHTFIDDCETPVSAYLKLRGAGPSFLLESAEQGQRFGRWSFLGVQPRSVIRLDDGVLTVDGARRAGADAPTPPSQTSSTATALRRSTGCRRSRAARSGCSATTSCAAPSRRSASATPTSSACPISR